MTANSLSSSVSPGAAFYIVITADAFEQAGFVDSSATAPSGAVTTGFALYGSDIMYIDGNEYLSQFWAEPTSSDDLYELIWNAGGESSDDAVPVNLKPMAPLALTS